MPAIAVVLYCLAFTIFGVNIEPDSPHRAANSQACSCTRHCPSLSELEQSWSRQQSGAFNSLKTLVVLFLAFNPSKGILLSGLPGVGKSTACRRVAELCREQGFRVEGFITEELRERGSRVGFDLVELGAGAAGRRVPLARTGDGLTGPRVGKYTVTLDEFESLAIPVLDRISNVASKERVVCIIDEIGKMELFSNSFVDRMRTLLAKRPVPMLFTIALKGGGFIAEAKRVRGLDYIEIDRETRDAAPADIVSRLLGGDSSSGNGSAAPARASRVSRWNAGAKAAASDTLADARGISDTMDKPAVSKRWRARESSPAKGEASESSYRLRPGGRVIVWLRNELRLADNPLLFHAVDLCKQHGATLDPIVCLDPRDFAQDVRTRFGSVKVGAARRKFLEEAILDLSQSLRQRGSCLRVCDAAPELALAALASQGDVVLATQEVCQEELDAERRVEAALKTVGADLRLLDSGGISTIFGISELQRARVGVSDAFPEDFKVFYNAVRNDVKDICQTGICDAPVELPASGPETAPVPGLRQPEGMREERRSLGHLHAAAGPAFHGGETAGLARMRLWLQDGGLRSYKATFRHLLGDYSSRLSAHLAYGCLSPRRVCAEALTAVQSGPHIEHFVYEMCWRDFFRHAARRWGTALFKRSGPLGSSAPARSWLRDAEMEDRWRCGTTGVPLVDAAMRELQATGYIGNLARQFTAAYLIEDLGLDWRVGADWFESALVDYDPHSNWGQWTRSAGVAPTNEAKRQRVGGTRYFDIALQIGQSEAAKYVRGWVPELATLPDSDILAPWRRDSAELGSYPQRPLCSAELRQYFEAARSKAGASKGGAKGSSGKGRGGRGSSGNQRRQEWTF